MALEVIDTKIPEASDPERQKNCAGLFIDQENNTVKRSVGYIKDNFKVFDLDNSGAISIPELESVNRNPATKAVERQAASFMINHFDQMANYIKGDDHGFDPHFKPVVSGTGDAEKDYIDLASVAITGATQDITITDRDVNAMKLTFEPAKRSELEKTIDRNRLFESIVTDSIGVPLGLSTGLLGIGPAMIIEDTAIPVLGAVGIAPAAAITIGLVASGAIAATIAVGTAAYYAYNEYEYLYKNVPSTSEIEQAHKQRQAMLDGWTCTK